jgi:hypothetical protein
MAEPSSPGISKPVAAPASTVEVKISSPSEKKEEDQSSKRVWLKAFVDWLFGWMLNWPALLVVGLLYLFLSRNAPLKIADLLMPFQSLKLFGTELVLSKPGGADLEDRLDKLGRFIKLRFDEWNKDEQFSEKHRKIIDSYVRPLVQNFETLNARSTIHVQDLLFGDAPYQLLDYYPRQNRGPRGRVFPIRAGIIGKTWRLSESMHEGSVSEDTKHLILDWGMTLDEARIAGRGRQSFGCVLLRSESNDALGIFYFDSPAKNAFEPWEQIEAAVLKGAEETGLLNSLDAMRRDLIERSARVDLYGRLK